MAKCLKNKINKKIIRVSNTEAKEKVASGEWVYTDKDSYIKYKNKAQERKAS